MSLVRWFLFHQAQLPIIITQFLTTLVSQRTWCFIASPHMSAECFCSSTFYQSLFPPSAIKPCQDSSGTRSAQSGSYLLFRVATRLAPRSYERFATNIIELGNFKLRKSLAVISAILRIQTSDEHRSNLRPWRFATLLQIPHLQLHLRSLRVSLPKNFLHSYCRGVPLCCLNEIHLYHSWWLVDSQKLQFSNNSTRFSNN